MWRLLNMIWPYSGLTSPVWTGMMFLIPILVLWSLVWKGLALYKAARLEQKVWFVVMLVLNTAGILEILYLYVFSKSSVKKPARRRR